MKRENPALTVYFAHPVTHYNQEIESVCIEIIHTMFGQSTYIDANSVYNDIEILNPNQQWIQNMYDSRKKNGHENPFRMFQEMAESCDITVGVAFKDGVIGAGVANEMMTAMGNGKDVYLIYFETNGRVLFMKMEDTMNFKVLSIEETRERNKDGII